MFSLPAQHLGDNLRKHAPNRQNEVTLALRALHRSRPSNTRSERNARSVQNSSARAGALLLLSIGLMLLAAACGQPHEAPQANRDVAPVSDHDPSAPEASFVMSSYAGGAPARIHFTNQSSNAERFLWDFGDGTTSTEFEPSHVFVDPGVHPVKLTAFTSRDKGAETDTLAQVVILYQPILTNISLEPVALTIEPGQQAQLTAKALDQFGVEIDGLRLDWSASGEAEIDPTTVLHAGTRVLHAGTKAGSFPNLIGVEASLGEVTIRTTANVEVVPGPLHRVLMDPLMATLSIGDSLGFGAVGVDEFGNVIAELTVDWTAVHGLGEMDSDGRLTTGTTAGTFEVIARASTSEVSRAASAMVVVRPDPLDAVDLRPRTATLAVGGSTQFFAAAVDRYGNLIEAASVTWSSEKASGTIDADGTFTAKTEAGYYPGSATARATHGATVRQASADVTLEPGRLAMLRLEPPTTEIAVGEALPLNVQAVDQYGNEIPGLLISYLWPQAAGDSWLDAAGTFIAGNGTGTFPIEVTARQDGVAKAAQITLTVRPGPIDRVQVAPAAATLKVGDSQEFTVRAFDEYGNEIDGIDAYWSADPMAGTIRTDGLFTAGARAGAYDSAVRVSVRLDGVSKQTAVLVRLTESEAQGALASISIGGD